MFSLLTKKIQQWIGVLARNKTLPEWVLDKNQVKAFLIHETIKVWIVVGYLAICFLILAIVKGLILQQYGVNYLGYGYVVALFGAVTLGKVVVLFEHSAIANRYSHKPLILAVLYKTVLTIIVVDIYTLIEHTLFELWQGHELTTLISHLSGAGIVAHHLALLIIFGLLFSLREINRLLGHGTLFKAFFHSAVIPSNQNQVTEKD